MTLRDGIARDVGGGSGWGTHVHPWLIHVKVWQKPPQYYKVISLQLKIFLKKEKKIKLKIFLLLAPFRGSSLPKHPGLTPPGIALRLPGALLGQGFSAFLVPQLSRFGIYILSFILAWDLRWSFRLATLTDFRCPQEFLPSALLIQRRGRRESDKNAKCSQALFWITSPISTQWA